MISTAGITYFARSVPAKNPSPITPVIPPGINAQRLFRGLVRNVKKNGIAIANITYAGIARSLIKRASIR